MNLSVLCSPLSSQFFSILNRYSRKLKATFLPTPFSSHLWTCCPQIYLTTFWTYLHNVLWQTAPEFNCPLFKEVLLAALIYSLPSFRKCLLFYHCKLCWRTVCIHLVHKLHDSVHLNHIPPSNRGLSAFCRKESIWTQLIQFGKLIWRDAKPESFTTSIKLQLLEDIA